MDPPLLGGLQFFENGGKTLKKLVCIILVVVMMGSVLSSCKSPAERELERAQRAADDAAAAYENASRKYDDLAGKLDSIERKSSALRP